MVLAPCDGDVCPRHASCCHAYIRAAVSHQILRIVTRSGTSLTSTNTLHLHLTSSGWREMGTFMGLSCYLLTENEIHFLYLTFIVAIEVLEMAQSQWVGIITWFISYKDYSCLSWTLHKLEFVSLSYKLSAWLGRIWWKIITLDETTKNYFWTTEKLYFGSLIIYV